MTVNTITGPGTFDLSPNVAHLRVEILTLPPGYSTGIGGPTDYFGVGAIRFGVQGSYYPKKPIDGFDILMDVPPGATTFGCNLLPGGSVRTTEITATALGNPARITRSANFQSNPNSGSTTLWTYTVPAGRLCVIDSGFAGVNGGTASLGYTEIQVGGGYILFLYSNPAITPSEWDIRQLPSQVLAGPGELVQAQGFNGTTTALSHFASIMGWEFDQQAWTPP